MALVRFHLITGIGEELFISTNLSIVVVFFIKNPQMSFCILKPTQTFRKWGLLSNFVGMKHLEFCLKNNNGNIIMKILFWSLKLKVAKNYWFCKNDFVSQGAIETQSSSSSTQGEVRITSYNHFTLYLYVFVSPHFSFCMHVFK